jgi:hypothetical protein
VLFRSVSENLSNTVTAMWRLLDSRAKSIFEVGFHTQRVRQFSNWPEMGFSEGSWINSAEWSVETS